MKPARRAMPVLAAVLAVGACGERAPDVAAISPASSATAAAAGTVAAGAAAKGTAAGQRPTAAPVAAPASALPGGGAGELVNPDQATMVFLYHELAGIGAPLDQWVASDSRVTAAAGPEKASRREQVRAELAAGLAAVRGIGYIRLTLNDRLSEYDPGYGEFTLRALAPSSSVPFKALQQEVALRFGNGRDAQIWAVPAAQAQAVQDSFRHGRDVVLDLLLKITDVQPATRGGTVVADVLEYEIRTQQGNQLLGRVKPVAK